MARSNREAICICSNHPGCSQPVTLMQGFLNSQTKEEMVMVPSFELVGMMEEKQVVERKITVFITMRSFKQMLVGAILKEVRLAMVSVMVEVRGTTPVMPLLWGIKRK
jgi:hypothetical protein